MILQRLAGAFREQSWFTVLVEVLVVVVGIFIGLQVDDWSQYRRDREDEVHYLERLHAEMLNAEKLSARVLTRRIDQQEVVFDILDVFFEDRSRTELSELECQTIGSMHYFNIAVSGLSAADELTASGRMGILLDTDLRAALGALNQALDATGIYIRIQNDVARSLSHEYPQLISLTGGYDPKRGEVVTSASCDLAAMRESRAFLNDLANNADVYDAYVRDAVAPWAEQMRIR